MQADRSANYALAGAESYETKVPRDALTNRFVSAETSGTDSRLQLERDVQRLIGGNLVQA